MRGGSHAQYDALMEEKDRLLRAYHAIGQTILSSLDLEQVLDTLPQQVLAAGIFRSLMVALVDEERRQVEVVRGLSSYANDIFVPCAVTRVGGREVVGNSYDLDDANVVAEVARTGQMQVIGGWDPERFDSQIKPNSGDLEKVSYFFPIKQGERVVAVLATSSSPEAREMVLNRIETMQPLLDQVAIALEHARLYVQIQAGRGDAGGQRCLYNQSDEYPERCHLYRQNARARNRLCKSTHRRYFGVPSRGTHRPDGEHIAHRFIGFCSVWPEDTDGTKKQAVPNPH
tara:strand:+ start:165 stop:1022 length:858 start_codon:yes stop_codon:yes gene_type:complete